MSRGKKKASKIDCTNPKGCSDPWPTGARLCTRSCYHKTSNEITARWDAEAAERESRGKYKGCPVCKIMVLFQCHHDGQDLQTVDLDWTEEELAAITHVREIIETSGRHSLTGCPPNFRAMCSHRLTLKRLQDEHRLPYIKGMDYDQLNR